MGSGKMSGAIVNLLLLVVMASAIGLVDASMQKENDLTEEQFPVWGIVQTRGESKDEREFRKYNKKHCQECKQGACRGDSKKKAFCKKFLPWCELPTPPCNPANYK